MKKTLLFIALSVSLFSFNQTVPNYVPTNGLIGWWPFNGNANDESINNNDGTVNGATLSTDRSGVSNSAYYFNGVSNKISLPNLGNLTEFSYSIWVKSDGDDGASLRSFLGSSGFWNVGNMHNNTELTNLKVAIAGGLYLTTTDYNLNNTCWVNITYTYKASGTAKIFLNGIEVANASTNATTTLFNSLTIGYEHNGNRYWNGKIDDLGFWSRELSPIEVQTLYHNPICCVDIIESACSSYTAPDGNTYTSSGKYSAFVPNPNGCDSIVTIDLTIINSNSSSESVSECDSYTWTTNGQIYTQNGQYSETQTNINGCDSTITLNLIITQSTTGIDVQTSCDNYAWIDGNTYNSSTNSPTFILTNTAGCDSTVTLNLTITNTNSGSESVSDCGSFTWNTNGQTYTQSGQYSEVLTNTTGCDSTVTLNLTILQPSLGTDVQTACGSYTWIDGNTYSVSTNTPTFILTNDQGCDSTVTLNLTILNPTINQVDTTICIGDSIALYTEYNFCDKINKAQFPGTNRIAGANAQIGNKGYYGTGYFQGTSGPIFYNDFWEYNNSLNSWTALPSYPGGNTHDPVIFAINGKIYLGLGAPASAEFWMFDPNTNSWIAKASFPGGTRYNAAYFSIGDNGYVVCGHEGATATTYDDVWKYNSITNNWIQLANFPGGPKRSPYGASQNNLGVVMGGNSSSDIWIFNPTSETWVQNLNNSIASRAGMVVSSDGNKIITSSGNDPINTNIIYSDINEYDILTDTWSLICGDTSESLYYPINFIFGNELYLGEGLFSGQGWTFSNLSYVKNIVRSNFSWSTGDIYKSLTVQPNSTTTYTLTESSGILSCTDEVTITVNNPQINAGSDVDVCDGEVTSLIGSGATTYSWNNSVTDGVPFTPNTSGYYTLTGTDAVGCSDMDSLYLSLLQPSSSTDVQTSCGDYTWIDGNTYSVSTNTPTFILTNNQGCDSTVTLDLTIINSNNSSESVSECDSYTWTTNGQIYTQSGQYSETQTNINGCDSTITLNLIITQSTTGIDVQTSCDNYAWIDGNTYNSSTNSPTFILTNTAGCDSTVTLNLTITNTNSGSESVNECGSFTWNTNGQTYTQSGQYSEVLTNTTGCDSTVTLNLTILQPSLGTDVQTACGSYTWIDGNSYVSSSSNPTFVLTNTQGCDSTVTLSLTITNSTSGSESISICNNYSWSANGQTYSQSGIYSETLTNINGCDSIATLNLTITNPSTGIDFQEVCDSYIWIDGNTYTSNTNSPTFILTNSEGCDSTITLDLIVNVFNDLIVNVPNKICEGNTLQLLAEGGVNYQWDLPINNGDIILPVLGLNTYNVSSTNQDGCSNSKTIQVEVFQNPQLNFRIDTLRCQGYDDGAIEVEVFNGTPPYSYDWSNGLDNNYINELSSGPYPVVVTDANNCSISDTAIILDSQNPCFYVNEGLSPNGDGINDVWNINGIDLYEEVDIKVYNRWGQVIYDYSKVQKLWDGTNEGKLLPSADYYYIIQIPNNNIKMNGIISLKR